VANQAETTITLTDAPDDGECAAITEGLRAFNEAQAGVSDSRALAILARDPETRNVVGGLLGREDLGQGNSKNIAIFSSFSREFITFPKTRRLSLKLEERRKEK
jgi:hypothetical protein